jgi:hypothetical protein
MSICRVDVYICVVTVCDIILVRIINKYTFNTYMIPYYINSITLDVVSVVQWSEFLAIDPEARVWNGVHSAS